MNIYKVEQDCINEHSTFTSFVCIVPNEQAARETHPSGNEHEFDALTWIPFEDIHKLKVTCIGYALPNQPKGVVCAHYYVG